ncbi:MAG: VWA domain-containing protein [Acidobacteriota bacterium]
MRRTKILCLLAALAWGMAGGQGKKRAPPVFRGGGLTVVVDTVVTDKKNRVVTDLKAEDFVVYEDGVEQRIDRFILYLQPKVGESARAQPVPKPTPRRPRSVETKAVLDYSSESPAGPNLIIFLLDYATTEFSNQKLVQNAATRYVKNDLRDNDLVAVFELGSGFHLRQEFTNDKNKLIQALRFRNISGQSLSSLNRSGPSAPSTGSDLVSSGSVTVTASNPQGMSAAGLVASTQGSELGDLNFALRIQRMFYNMQSHVQSREARGVLTAIQAISKGVASIEGRKNLVLFSSGFVVGPLAEETLSKTVSIANAANLAIYGMDSHGLTTGGLSKSLVPGDELSSISASRGAGNAISGRRIDATGGESLFDRAKQVGSDVRDSALRYVSAATGGFAVRNMNDLYLGLKRFDSEVHTYYLLTYHPLNQEFEGGFRSIRVEVKKPGYTVRHRSGYLAVPRGLEILTGSDYKLLRAAQEGELPLDLPAYLRLETFSSDPAKQQVLISLEIPAAGLAFREEESENGAVYRSRIRVLGLLRDSNGVGLLRFGTPMNLTFTPEEYRAVRKGGLSLNDRLELSPGIYSIQMLVQDAQTQRAVLLERSLRIQPSGKKLRMSTIVLGKDVQRSPPGAKLLTFEHSTLLPSASRRFHNGENLVFYFEVYDCQLNQERADLLAEVSLIRSGSSRGVNLPEFQIRQPFEAQKVAFSRYVELKGLQAGTYFLVVKLTDRLGSKTISRRTPFFIVGG